MTHDKKWFTHMRYKSFKEWKAMKEALEDMAPELPQPPPVPPAQPKKVLYSAIVLNGVERQKLTDVLKDRLEPLLRQGWKMQNSPPPGVEPEVLPHHMTIVPGQPLPPDMRDLIGTKQDMVAYMWGQNEQAAAVAVRCGVRSTNAQPHITVAVSPIGKPFHSNNIKEWEPISEIQLSGIVEEVTAKK
jgi:hypothetical protein